MRYRFGDGQENAEMKDRLVEVELNFDVNVNEPSKMEALEKSILKAYVQQYGDCREEHRASGEIVYVWHFEGSNLQIQVINWQDDMGITVSYTVTPMA